MLPPKGLQNWVLVLKIKLEKLITTFPQDTDQVLGVFCTFLSDGFPQGLKNL